MSRVVVTGVAGFLGSHLADSFLARGDDVVGIDNLVGGGLDNVPDGVEFHAVDCADLESVKPLVSGADLVVHAACTAYEGLSVFSPALVVQNTMQATASMLSAAVGGGVGKFVYCSSMARYGTQPTVPFRESMTPAPQDPYGIAKRASEQLVENLATTHGLAHVVLVPHNIYGPRQRYTDPYRNVAAIMANRMLQGQQPIIYGDGLQRRCFSYIDDVLAPMMLACTTDRADGLTVNIGPDEEFVSIAGLARTLADVMAFDLDPIYMPGRPQEVRDANCSADLARDVLDYRTTTALRDGLAHLVEWIAARGPRPFDYHLPLEFTTERTPRTWTERLM